MTYANEFGNEDVREIIRQSHLSYYGTADTKKIKRIERKVMGFDAVHDAYRLGEYQFMAGRAYRNPFPAGRRHDEFKRGFEGGDVLGFDMALAEYRGNY